jgi:hypothetical protein
LKTTHRIFVDDAYIAETQRLALAQNKALKLMYQTLWGGWLPRLVLFVCGVSFMFAEILRPAGAFSIALLVLSFGGEVLKRRGLAKARKKVRTKGSTNTVTMDDQGIVTSSVFGTSRLEWTIMLPPAIYPDGVLIKLSRASMVWLPDQTLVEGSPADVRQLLAENVKV